jgi:phosphoglycolate phosphatase-like HAD superfamily hydrolase
MEEVTVQSQKVDPFSYSHVIFDFDDTLAKLLIDWPKWKIEIAKLIQNYQTDFTLERATALNHFVINQYITRYGDTFRSDFIRVSAQAEKDNYHGYRIINEGMNLLEKLHRAEKDLYLLTSNCRLVIDPVLEELSITKHFKKIITTDEVDNLKPTSAPFKLIYEQGRPLSDYLMIGDSSSDSGFAKSAGIDYLDVRDI